MSKLSLKLSRRNLLLGALNGAGLLLLSGCEKALNGLSRNETVSAILAKAEGGNRRVQRFLASRNKLAQEFSEKDISPKFRSNGNPPPNSAREPAERGPPAARPQRVSAAKPSSCGA